MHFVNWMHFGARWMHVRTKSCYALYVKTIISCFVSDNTGYDCSCFVPSELRVNVSSWVPCYSNDFNSNMYFEVFMLLVLTILIHVPHLRRTLDWLSSFPSYFHRLVTTIFLPNSSKNISPITMIYILMHKDCSVCHD